MLPPEPKKDSQMLDLTNVVSSERINTHFLTVSGVKQSLFYQLTFKNLIELAESCSMCEIMTLLLFVSSFVTICIF
jgi:hypothetical protein